MTHKGCKGSCILDEDEIQLKDDHNHKPPKTGTKGGRWIIPNETK